MPNDEARSIAEYLIVRRGDGAYMAALDHADRLAIAGELHLAAFWKDIAAEVAVLEARVVHLPC